jgi:hypothetical protein
LASSLPITEPNVAGSKATRPDSVIWSPPGSSISAFKMANCTGVTSKPAVSSMKIDTASCCARLIRWPGASLKLKLFAMASSLPFRVFTEGINDKHTYHSMVTWNNPPAPVRQCPFNSKP